MERVLDSPPYAAGRPSAESPVQWSLNWLVRRYGCPLEWPAIRKCLLLVSLAGLFSTWNVCLGEYLRRHLDLVPFLDHALLESAVRGGRLVVLGYVGLFLAGVSLLRCAPDSRCFVHLTFQFFAITTALTACLSDPLGASFWLSIIGFCVIGLLLFGESTVATALLTFVAICASSVTLASLGFVPYAPLVIGPPFTEDKLAGWWVAKTGIASILILGVVLVLCSYIFGRWRDREAELKDLSNTDPLTRLANKRHLLELGSREFARRKRHGGALSCIMVDLDHFKAVNDRYGHLAGDVVLGEVAKILRQVLRSHDVAGRYGGEEFALLLPDTELDPAIMVAERCRRVIEDTPLITENTTIRITASMGVASVSSSTIEFRDLLRFADKALYAAKQDGRNTVVAAGLTTVQATRGCEQ
ncbi:MAG: GGDEF domain-containing protein [Acidobacteriota bacterium]